MNSSTLAIASNIPLDSLAKEKNYSEQQLESELELFYQAFLLKLSTTYKSQSFSFIMSKADFDSLPNAALSKLASDPIKRTVLLSDNNISMNLSLSNVEHFKLIISHHYKDEKTIQSLGLAIGLSIAEVACSASPLRAQIILDTPYLARFLPEKNPGIYANIKNQLQTKIRQNEHSTLGKVANGFAGTGFVLFAISLFFLSMPIVGIPLFAAGVTGLLVGGIIQLYIGYKASAKLPKHKADQYAKMADETLGNYNVQNYLNKQPSNQVRLITDAKKTNEEQPDLIQNEMKNDSEADKVTFLNKRP